MHRFVERGFYGGWDGSEISCTLGKKYDESAEHDGANGGSPVFRIDGSLKA